MAAHGNRNLDRLACHWRSCWLARWPDHEGWRLRLVGNIVVGIVGAVVGGWSLPRLGVLILGGILGEILNAVIGACLVLFVLQLVKR